MLMSMQKKILRKQENLWCWNVEVKEAITRKKHTGQYARTDLKTTWQNTKH